MIKIKLTLNEELIPKERQFEACWSGKGSKGKGSHKVYINSDSIVCFQDLEVENALINHFMKLKLAVWTLLYVNNTAELEVYYNTDFKLVNYYAKNRL